MSSPQTEPRWQLESIFPSLRHPAFAEAKDGLRRGLDELASFLDSQGVVRGGHPPAGRSVAWVFEQALARFNALLAANATLSAYLTGFVSTDAFDDGARAEQSALEPLNSRLAALTTRFQAWLGGLDHEALKIAAAAAAEHAFFLERSRIAANHQLPPEAEELAAALAPTGTGAWGRLHSNLISKGTIFLQLPGRSGDEYGLAQLKNLQASPDPAVRQASYQAELELLARNEVPFAAAMNAIKGEVGELGRRRGWQTPVRQAVIANNLSETSLEAMQQACIEHFPIFRRYLKAKAGLLGKRAIPWYDLQAPLEHGRQRTFSWAQAKEFVVHQFSGYAAPLAAFATAAFDDGWIDVAPRRGKRNGAFCMGVPERHESRVLLNFGGTLDDVFTLAHELGHGYHNACRYAAGRSYLQGLTPMVLAETASIFCETIVANAMLAQASDGERFAILEQDLLGATQLVVDIHSRFLFEQEVFDQRRRRELSVDELNGIMLEAQAATYGEALASDARHPYMWAHKGHYYSGTRSFYNFPYTFGYLLGQGLFAEYQKQPEGFPERYDTLLANTGMADPVSLAAAFGIDLEDPDFWRSSLAIAAARVAEYEQLATQAGKEGAS